jgi:hypothetical protein
VSAALDLDLPRGWTLSRVEKVATRVAFDQLFPSTLSVDDKRSAARDALLEEIFAASDSGELTVEDAWRIARGGVRQFDRSQRRVWGRDDDHAAEVGYGPAVYFNSVRRPPQPEDLIVERLALQQAWTVLTDEEASVIVAWASFDDRRLAAESLGFSKSQFERRLAMAKRRFLAAWFDWESIPPTYSKDFRTSAPSGDGWLDNDRRSHRHAAYKRHRKQRVADGRPITHTQARTHCPRGHRLDEPNLRANRASIGQRECLACHRAKSSESYARKRGRDFDLQTVSDARYAEIMRPHADRDVG